MKYLKAKTQTETEIVIRPKRYINNIAPQNIYIYIYQSIV